MVIDEVRFAPEPCATIHHATEDDLRVFKHSRYVAYLPPRDKNEIIVEIGLALFKKGDLLKVLIHSSNFCKANEGYMKGIWHWNKCAIHAPAPASLEEVQRFLSEIGYEVNKITLLEND